MNIAYHLSLKTDPTLFTDVHLIDKGISVVLFNRYNQKKWNVYINGH